MALSCQVLVVPAILPPRVHPLTLNCKTQLTNFKITSENVFQIKRATYVHVVHCTIWCCDILGFLKNCWVQQMTLFNLSLCTVVESDTIYFEWIVFFWNFTGPCCTLLTFCCTLSACKTFHTAAIRIIT